VGGVSSSASMGCGHLGADPVGGMGTSTLGAELAYTYTRTVRGRIRL